MNEKLDITGLPCALVPSRRRFMGMTFAAAGSPTLPAVATAARGKTSRLPQPRKKELEDCMAHLSEILAEMHPNLASAPRHWLNSQQDGSFELLVRGQAKFVEFTGDGLYLVSMGGCLLHWWLERDFYLNQRTGEPIAGMVFYHATLWDDARLTDEVREMWEPKLFRKLDWVRT